MLQQAKLAGALVVSAVIGSIAFTPSVQAQVVDGTGGKVSRCDMFRALGRNLPPECGGTGRPGGDTTRGRVVIGTPDAGGKPATAPAAAGTAPSAATPPAGSSAAAGTPPPAATAPAATQPQAPKGIGLAVPFAIDSDQLTPEARRVVDQLAEVFKLNPSDRFLIEGHTDTTGGEAYNRNLSERRAQAVINYLVSQHGLSRDRFEGRGLGSSKLLLPNDPTNGRNRRVQVLNIGS
ncbi:OmpA family protein [Vineibacter terrae]|uniref:OmpA family protein n=1 Tax=Vineibacter terrae TaxID=2586908 RepID=UPI002E32615A|nr:OmpA family protein [Vineibacter terrae]HEX2891248.1 OmpA family protein [Vineibacter terrae]